ncbi:MAG: hypothetical protein MZV64_70540 [Ignavibacteriales bacterium]|nr:hypothetical protein [Ignavibacteriales bacterium]
MGGADRTSPGTFRAQGYQVKVVDRRPEVVARLRQEIEGEVICGDGSQPAGPRTGRDRHKAGPARGAGPRRRGQPRASAGWQSIHFNVPRVHRAREQPAERVALHQGLGRGRRHQPGAHDRQGHRGRDRPGELVTLLKLNRGEAALVEMRLPEGRSGDGQGHPRSLAPGGHRHREHHPGRQAGHPTRRHRPARPATKCSP